ncbi:unnamed protein product [Mesocestoides corti]|uniref:CTNNB1_binding domain-containing protein n=1 Tax=Mesocestoides corti TaxID=53468 RepID=A0A0R3UGV3_MESCO|nr:unnamed protein product [Mesocestoides corti]
MNSVAGEDLACTDEIKVYEDEGEEDEQVKSSENLTEDKVGLVIESEGQCLSVASPPFSPLLVADNGRHGGNRTSARMTAAYKNNCSTRKPWWRKRIPSHPTPSTLEGRHL